MKNNKAHSGAREFFTVLGIAVLIAAVMTLLAAVPPASFLYRWLAERGLQYVWTGITAGAVGGVLSFCRIREKEKAASGGAPGGGPGK